MRGTTHNARVRKDGSVFSAKHNDRQFDITKHNTIVPEKTQNNIIWMAIPDAVDFENCEMRFYEDHFSSFLTTRNQKYVKSRHKERVMTMDQYRGHKDHCPEETIFQVGKEGSTIDPDLLRKIFEDFLAWRSKTYPQVISLDWALHQDETTPHVHLRSVWIGHDKDGTEVVSQNKALSEMGVERPDPSRSQTKWNNPKQTYTKSCREAFLQICIQHGLQMDLDPLEHSKTGLAQEEYQYRQVHDKRVKEEEQLRSMSLPKNILGKEKHLFGKDLYYVQDPDYIRCLMLQKQELESTVQRLKKQYEDLQTTYDYVSKELSSAQRTRESWNDKYNNLKKQFDDYKRQVKYVRDPVGTDDGLSLDTIRSMRGKLPRELYNEQLIKGIKLELDQWDPSRISTDSLEALCDTAQYDVEIDEGYLSKTDGRFYD